MKKTFSDITILIDIDDTLIELLPAWCKWLNDLYGLNVKPDEVTDWDVARFFPTLTKEQVFAPLHTDHFWEAVEPKEDAVKYVKQLIDEGHNVYLCTTTDYRNIRAKFERVIQKHFPYINWDQVIIASYKQMINADILIDDGVHNLENGNYIKFLFTAPHNRQYDAISNNMYRVNNWEQVYIMIQLLELWEEL